MLKPMSMNLTMKPLSGVQTMPAYYKSSRNMILTDCSTAGTVWDGRDLTMDAIRVTYDPLHSTLGLFPLVQLITLVHALTFLVGATHWSTLASIHLHGLHMASPLYSSRTHCTIRVVGHMDLHRIT